MDVRKVDNLDFVTLQRLTPVGVMHVFNGKTYKKEACTVWVRLQCSSAVF